MRFKSIPTIKYLTEILQMTHSENKMNGTKQTDYFMRMLKKIHILKLYYIHTPKQTIFTSEIHLVIHSIIL